MLIAAPDLFFLAGSPRACRSSICPLPSFFTCIADLCRLTATFVSWRAAATCYCSLCTPYRLKSPFSVEQALSLWAPRTLRRLNLSLWSGRTIAQMPKLPVGLESLVTDSALAKPVDGAHPALSSKSPAEWHRRWQIQSTFHMAILSLKRHSRSSCTLFNHPPAGSVAARDMDWSCRTGIQSRVVRSSCARLHSLLAYACSRGLAYLAATCLSSCCCLRHCRQTCSGCL